MPSWHSRKSPASQKNNADKDHLELARESLQELLGDGRVPNSVRQALASDYKDVELMLDKLRHGHLHIVVFGRVSVGKSALLNALLGEQTFSTSPLHGETRESQSQAWQEYRHGNTFLIDTPGIDEMEGEAREQLAHDVAARADLVLFVVDGDITETETTALREISKQNRPILLVLNKTDRYSEAETDQLLASLQHHTEGLIEPENIIPAAANPATEIVIRVDATGNETETRRQPDSSIAAVQNRIWEILEAEGKTLAALNASLFASQLSDQVGAHMLQARRALGQRLIRVYCVSKGVAVALNPIPITDLVAALAVDIGMILHLSSLYGLPLSRTEATGLVKTIGGQILLLMGTVWAVNLVSSALKLGTGGLSTLVTGGAQGLVAYYSTYIVGQAAEHYLSHGKSWGKGGPKYVVKQILETLDRDSIIDQAKQDIRDRLKMHQN